jgi:peptidoglycan/LPS O-acetylase OafA/YrhL
VVVIYHFAQHWTGRTRTSVGPGYLAVDLFFVLSGFMMTMVYGDQFTGHTSGSQYRNYLWRRFARVYPAYFVVIVIEQFLSVSHIDPRPLSATAFAGNLFLLQYTGVAIFTPELASTLVGVSWSLSTELVAYVSLPLLIRIVGYEDNPRRQIVVALSGVAVLWAIVAFGPPSLSGPLDNVRACSLGPVIRCLADYLIGMSVWHLVHSWKERPRPRYLGIAASAIIAVLWRTPSSDLWIVPAFAVLIGLIYTPTDRLSQLLSTPPLFFLGQVSYALYLIHNPSTGLLPVLSRGLSAMHVPHEHYLAFVLLVPIDIGLAYLTYRFVEKPAQRYLQRLTFTRRAPTAAAEPAAP